MIKELTSSKNRELLKHWYQNWKEVPSTSELLRQILEDITNDELPLKKYQPYLSV